MIHTGQIDQWVATAVAVLFGLYVLRTVVGVALSIAATCLGRADGLLRAAAQAVTPKLVQRLLAGLLGSATIIGPGAVAAHAAIPDIDRGPVATQPAMASPAPTDSGVTSSQSAGAPQAAIDADLPGSTAVPDSAGNPAGPEHRTITVKPGDCLWSLAQHQLGSSATPAAVERQSKRWYSINKAVIGPNPDLILDGQQLQIPGVTS